MRRKKSQTGFGRMLPLGMAWLLAAALFSVAVPGRAEAALGNVVYLNVSPADGSALQGLSRLEIEVEDPEGDPLHSAGYRIKRLSDNKYLWSGETPESSWLDMELVGVGMTDGGGGMYYTDLPQEAQDALYEDGPYEIRYFVRDTDGERVGWSYKTVTVTLDRTPPGIAGASVSREALRIEFTEPLVKTEWERIAAEHFDILVNGEPASIEFVAEIVGEPETVLVFLQTPVKKADVLTVAFSEFMPFTDAAGNAASTAPVEAVNWTPGAFEETPELKLHMKAGYALKAGDAIVRFVPSASGAIQLRFGFPRSDDNSPSLRAGAVAKTDFVVKDLTADTVMAPEFFTMDNEILYQIYLGLPEAFVQGHEYELAMSESASGDEIRMPALPADDASAFLYLLIPNTMSALDEYAFENLVIDEPDPVDFSALAEAVAEAQAKHNAATEGAANGQYAPGAKAALQSAIDAAAAVLDAALATQEEVDAALAELNAAVGAFEEKKVVVDMSALDAVIAEAEAKRDAATEGASNGQYAPGAKAALQSEINIAKVVRNNASTTQMQADETVDGLKAAIRIFEGKKVAVDFSALAEAVAEAQAMHDAATEGAANGQYAPGARAALQSAIDVAAAVLDDALATQARIDAALAELNEAVETFEKKKVVGGGTPGGGGGVADGTISYTLTVDFGKGNSGKLSVKRTVEADGRVTDSLEIPDAFSKDAAEKLKASGQDLLMIAFPASDLAAGPMARAYSVRLPVSAANRLASESISLVVRTPEAELAVPSSSFKGAKEELHFLFSPVRNAAGRSGIEARANGSSDIRAIAGAEKVAVIGQPVTVELNLTSGKATLALPLGKPDTAAEAAAIYIEHSNGTKELARGRTAERKDERNVLLLEIDVSRSGTFAIVDVPGWMKPESERELRFLNVPYMTGFAGGRFKPDASITRAEIAAILARIVDGEAVAPVEGFPDLQAGYWARGAIGKMVSLGVMNGTPDGRFQPD